MDRKLAEKLINNENFKIFCSQMDVLKKHGYRLNIPFDTALMLYDAGIDFLKDERNLDAIHQAAVEFLENENVSGGFYDFIVSVIGST